MIQYCILTLTIANTLLAAVAMRQRSHQIHLTKKRIKHAKREAKRAA